MTTLLILGKYIALAFCLFGAILVLWVYASIARDMWRKRNESRQDPDIR